MDLPEKIHADSLNRLKIVSTNLNNVFETAVVSVNLVKLKMPSRIFRERLWEQADQQVIDEKTYISLFPHDAYKNENEPSVWEEAGTVLSFTDTTRENGIFKLPAANWKRDGIVSRQKQKIGQAIPLV